MHACRSLPLFLFAFLIHSGAASASATASVPAPAGGDFGPFTLKVEIQGVTQGVFGSVEGLASRSEVLADTGSGGAGDLSQPPVEMPGALKGSRLVLKRPYDPLLSGLWQWRQSVVEGAPQKRDGDIFIFTAKGRLAAHWIFHQGWPSSWEVPALKAGTREPAEEIVEIVHAGLTLESQADP